MKLTRTAVILGISLLAGCAQVPPSSVTVSQSIGNDVLSMSQAHSAFVNAYFDSLEKEINFYIDHTYAPELIAAAVREDKKRFDTPADQDASVIFAVQEAFVNVKDKTDSQIAEDVDAAMLGMRYFIEIINEDIVKRRNLLLNPVKTKRAELLNSIQSNYQNIIHKSSTITGLLSSVVEIHQAQNEILTELGFEEGLREKVGTSLTELSGAVNEFRRKIEAGNNSVEKIEEYIDEFSTKLSSIDKN
ncbi:hypothetical protein [Planctobacterium marinum]|uniref:Lipoprotein n=1 Tax=Planctobacterium marinum TaxID=1631968 RepID=A0AA48KQA1_9ALTE|nr:hypothetical protein MACH26_03830 [Planctobacterium marinum]